MTGIIRPDYFLYSKYTLDTHIQEKYTAYILNLELIYLCICILMGVLKSNLGLKVLIRNRKVRLGTRLKKRSIKIYHPMHSTLFVTKKNPASGIPYKSTSTT